MGAFAIHQRPRQFWPNNHPIRRGLISDIPFLERAQTGTARNLAGNKLNGSYLTTPTPVAEGMQFTTGNSRVEIAHNSLFNVTALTMEVWFRKDAAGTNAQLIKKDTAWILRYNDTANFRAILFGLSTTNLDYNGISVTIGLWYHYVVTYFSGTASMYINGALATQNTGLTGTLGTSANTIGIGDTPGGGEKAPHTQALNRIWNRALSAGEVRQLYANPWLIYRRSLLQRQLRVPVSFLMP